MQETLDGYESGILVAEVQLQEVQPPEEVREALREVEAP